MHATKDQKNESALIEIEAAQNSYNMAGLEKQYSGRVRQAFPY